MSYIEPLLKRYGEYSRTGLVLLLDDEKSKSAYRIWEYANRYKRIECYADTIQLNEIVALAQCSDYDAIMFRLVERLSAEQQIYLARLISKMSSVEKGKIIFTTNDNFDELQTSLTTQLCKIQMSFMPEDYREIQSA